MSSDLLALRVLGVNVGRCTPLRAGERTVSSAIGKRPVSGPVEVRPLGLHGDEQADLSVHGGLAKAVYAYPAQHYAFWRTVRAQARVSLWDEDLPHGFLGENLTLQGVEEKEVWVGDRYVFPDCTLVVSAPRLPCFKFNAVMGFNQAGKLMAQSGFCGWYFAVARPGTIEAGQAYRIEPGAREMGLLELFRSYKSGRVD